MKNHKRFMLILLASFLIISTTGAQTAEEVVNKHFEAIGGKDKVKSITSVILENTSQVMGSDAPSNSTILIGKGFRSDFDFNGQKITQVVTDRGGWSVNPMAGGTDPQPMQENMFKQQRNQLYFFPFAKYADIASKIEMMGKEKVGNSTAYKINLTDKDDYTISYFIDSITYYITKMSKRGQVDGQDAELSATYSDFRKTDFGVIVPFTTILDFGGQFQLTTTLKKIEFNKPVDPAIFEMRK